MNLNLKNIWLFFLMAFAVAFSPRAYADGDQEKGYASLEKGMTRNIDWMKKNLNLTSDQLSRIQSIQKDALSQINGLKANTAMDHKAKMNELVMVRDNFNSQVKTVLTPDQVTKYDQYLMEMKNKSMEKMEY